MWGDHGWHLGDHRVWGKHTIFERALRSPLIIKVPGMKRRGHFLKSIVSSVDIYPSLMELCGVAMPHQTDGKSFVKLLATPGSKNWNDRAFGYFNKGVTLRTARFRLTRYFREDKPVIELYDHKKDPHENHNIAADRPATVRRLIPILGEGYTGLYEGE